MADGPQDARRLAPRLQAPDREGSGAAVRILPLAHGRRLALDRPLVMAILNATPDSFSDGGALFGGGRALADRGLVEARVLAAVAEGADILDVGGESTRPGHAPVPVDEETARVLPVLDCIRRVAPDAVVSVDTRKAAVARAALDAGAHMLNDVSGLDDPGMAGVVRKAGCSVVVMRHESLAGDIVAGARRELAGRVELALAAGIPREAIVVDPGVGFGDPPGADVQANLALISRCGEVADGYPVLVGASRKRFLGTLGGEAVPARRVGASVAAAVLAVQGGAQIVRVHDVGDTVQALRVLQAALAASP